MSETDAVLNPETRRALRRRVQQLTMLVVGGLIAIVLFGMAGVAALLSVPWQLSLAVTVGVTVAVPVAVPYAMLRVLGLSHRDVIFVGKQAYREGVAETVALRGSATAASTFAEQETTEGIGNGLLTPDGGESEGEGEDESAESAEKSETENSNADESAESDTGPANPQDND